MAKTQIKHFSKECNKKMFLKHFKNFKKQSTSKSSINCGLKNQHSAYFLQMGSITTKNDALGLKHWNYNLKFKQKLNYGRYKKAASAAIGHVAMSIQKICLELGNLVEGA